eukprot:5343725-Heterocapsa_arctica.AAC.1
MQQVREAQPLTMKYFTIIIELEIEINIEISNIQFRGYRAIGETSRHRRQMRNETLYVFRKV